MGTSQKNDLYEINDNGDIVIKKEVVEELKDIQKKIKSLQTREKKIKNDIAKLGKGKLSSFDVGGITISVVAPYIAYEFDLEKFKEEQPVMYNHYQQLVYKGVQYKVLVKKGE